jgi:hypothetical protein
VQSLYTDIFDALTAATFAIPNVVVRRPFDEGPKTYPALVVHEITNIPASHGTVTGEATTVLAYQIDILTQNFILDGTEYAYETDPVTQTYHTDGSGIVVSRYQAGQYLLREVSDLLDERFKLTRKSKPPPDSPAPDVMRHIWRGEATLASSGYSYRP